MLGSNPEPLFVDLLLEAQESIPSLAGRYDNHICRIGPPGYIGSSESIPRLHKRLQIRALDCCEFDIESQML